MPVVKCPNCDRDDEFATIGNHWRQSCDYPTLSPEDVELFQGLMMGDACVKNKVQGNASLDVMSVNVRFLEWLDEYLGVLSTGIHLKASAEAIERRYKTSDLVSYSGNDPINPVYRLTTRNLPALNRFRSWYDSGQKRFPDALELTSIVAKFWYVCDGGLSWNRKSNSCRVQICTTNEIDRPEYLLSLFRPQGLDPTVLSDRLMFNRSDSTRFLDWIGDPIPGFEYKWMDRDWSRYEQEFTRSRAYAGRDA